MQLGMQRYSTWRELILEFRRLLVRRNLGRQMLNLPRYACARHKNYRRNHNRAASQYVGINALVKHQPSEKDRDDRVHVCIRRNLRGGCVSQDVDIRGVTDQRPANDEVRDGANAASSPVRVMKV